MFLRLELTLFALAILRGASIRDDEHDNCSVVEHETAPTTVGMFGRMKSNLFSLFTTPNKKAEAEALSGGPGVTTQVKRDRLKKLLQAGNVNDCGVTDLAGKLLATPKPERELDWDNIIGDIEWATIKEDFGAYFDSVDTTIKDFEHQLESAKAELAKTPELKPVDKAKVADIPSNDASLSEYCKDKNQRMSINKQDDIIKVLEEKFQELTLREKTFLRVNDVLDSFTEKYPNSREKEFTSTTGRRMRSACFSLKSKLASDINTLPMAANSNSQRMKLKDKVDSLPKDIETEKTKKLTCEARLVDLEDFMNMLTKLKDTRQEKFMLTEAAGDTIDELSDEVAKATESITTQQDTLNKVIGTLDQNKMKSTRIQKQVDHVNKAIASTTKVKKELDDGLKTLQEESDKATAAVEASEKVKALVALFVQVFLETYKEAVRAPIGDGIAFTTGLDEMNQIADKMTSNGGKFEKEPFYGSFERTANLLNQLKEYCTVTAWKALTAIDDVKVKDEAGTDNTASAICSPHVANKEENNIAKLKAHIEIKRVAVGNAIRELTKLMADETSDEETDADSMMDKRLRQFQSHAQGGAAQGIYDDYLQHWRGGQGNAKKGLYLQLVLQLKGTKDGLSKTKKVTIALIENAKDNLKKAQEKSDTLTKNLAEVVKKMKADETKMGTLNAEIKELQEASKQMKDQIKKVTEERDALEDEVEKIEQLIITSHAEVKASLLELGIEEHEYESELERVREELKNSPAAHFALEGMQLAGE